jgi:membrane associated rhomboid family serine protease
MTTPVSPVASPKKKRLPYIIFAIAFIGYFLIIVLTPATFDWGSAALAAVFAIGIHGIWSGWLRPPGWKRRQREREHLEEESRPLRSPGERP